MEESNHPSNHPDPLSGQPTDTTPQVRYLPALSEDQIKALLAINLYQITVAGVSRIAKVRIDDFLTSYFLGEIPVTPAFIDSLLPTLQPVTIVEARAEARAWKALRQGERLFEAIENLNRSIWELVSSVEKHRP